MIDIERLRALEKDLREEERQQLAESRRHESEGNDETVQAFCNGKAFGLNAAAQRIASLIAELGQEVGAVDYEAAQREFTEYFVKNYPGPHTVIMDPTWHAPKIFRAAKRALRTSPAHTSEARDAYRHGWINSALWANRDDLIADIDSPAYVKARDVSLAAADAAAWAKSAAMRQEAE